MARKPAKAPESGPPVGFVLLRSDGKAANVADISNGKPFVLSPAEYTVANSRVSPPHVCGWMLQALKFSQPLFQGRYSDEPVLFEFENSRFCVSGLPGDWGNRLNVAMAHYFKNRLDELHAVDEAAVKEALRAIAATARKLKKQLDGPESSPKHYHAAWTRIAQTRFSAWDDCEDFHKFLYPGLSLLTARLDALAKEARNHGTRPDSVHSLVRMLAEQLAEFGVMATGSNGIVSADGGGELSALARLVKTILEGAGLPSPMTMTDAALNQAVIVALRKR